MKVKIYSVFDSKCAFFQSPFFEQREGAAIRGFSDAVNDNRNPNNQLYKHPEDYSLWLLGEFDDFTGTFDPCKPLNLVTASALRSAISPEVVNA